MPEPAIATIIQRRKRVAESEARLTALDFELHRLKNEGRLIERSGPTSRRFELRAHIDRLTTSRAELLGSLMDDRAALSESIRKAVASPDPERDFKRLAAGYPILLLPVAIETRFSTEAEALLIRAFPDDIHINSHEPELTDFEIECGTSFNASIAAAALEPERREALEELAWAELNQQLGPGRAAWVVRSLRDADVSAIARRFDAWTRAPHCSALPDRWLALGYRNGQRVFTRLGNPIPDDLEVGPAPGEDAEFDQDSAIQAGLKWLVDFDEAVRVGMALRVPYEADPSLPTEGLDQLLLVGVKSTLEPLAATGRFSKLLDAHHYTAGLSIVRQNTPTNNTYRAASGYDSGASSWSGLEREFRRVRSSPSGVGNADRLARAWGMGAQTTQVSLRCLEHADGREDLDAAQMNAALWPVTWGYFLTRMMRPEDGVPSESHEARIDQARSHFLRHVRARGPLPALRIGDQPYGILPAIALNQWRPADKPESGFERDLADLLLRLREFWRESRQAQPRPDTDLLQVLRLNAVSSHYRARSVQGPEFQRNLIEILLDPNRSEARTLRDVFENQRRAAEEILHRLQVPLTGSVLAGSVLAEFAHRLDDDLARLPTSEAGEPPPSNYIAWLLGATFQQIRDEVAPGMDPRAPLPLLHLLLRHAALAEFVDSGALVLRRVLVSTNLRAEPELVDISEADQTATPWRALETLVHQEGLPDQSLGTILNNRKQRPSPLVPTKFSEFWNALSHLQRLPDNDLELLMRETLDLCTHRFDAWVTSLADKRLATLRSTPGFEEGLHLGGFGWVEDLRAAPESVSEGYVHAPSLAQAATAAVLRNGYLAHRGESRGSALALNLESRRVDLALQLLTGIRQGQPLGALLGYRFERGLHEGHPGLELDEFIVPLRARFGFGNELVSVAAEPSEEIPPTLTIDGLHLHRFWSEAVEAAQGDRSAKSRAGYLAVAEAAEAFHGALPRDPSDGRAAAIMLELERLDDAIDAVSDLSLAEGVHQLVEGNPERAAAVAGAVSASGHAPPEMEVVRTPRTGVTINHRVLTLFTKPPPRAPGWNPETPRARAEPYLDAWASSIFGDAKQIRADIVFQGRQGGPPVNLPPIKISVAELGLGALDFVHLAEGDETGASSELAERIRFHISRSMPPEVVSVDQIAVHFRRGPAWRPDELSYRECLEPLRALRQLLGSSRPLRVSDLTLPEDELPAALDLGELRQRATDARDGLKLARGALHDLFEVPRAGARQRLAEWLQLANEDCDNLLDLPNGSDLASVARNHDLLDLGIVGLEELNFTRQAVRRFADFGLPASLPASLLGEDASDRIALLEQAFSLYRGSGKRLAAANAALAGEPSAGDPRKRARLLTDSLRSIFGPSFQAVPKILLETSLATELERVFDPATHERLVDDPEATERWLRQSATVRGRLRPFEDCFFFAELYNAPLDRRVQVGQLPYRAASEREAIPADRWAALPLREGERLVEDRFSLVAHLPAPLDEPEENGIRGLLIDEWSEVLPNSTETTGVTFHFDSPATRPPQTMLLAVPPAVQEEGTWSLEWLERIILETMELAQLRTVDLDSLRGLGQFLPAVFLAYNLDGDTVSTDFAPLHLRPDREDRE